MEIISLRENRIAPCVGCGSCQVHGECFMKDKLNDILDKVSADPSNESIDGALETVKGFLRCVDNVNLKGVVYGVNLNDQGDARYS